MKSTNFYDVSLSYFDQDQARAKDLSYPYKKLVLYLQFGIANIEILFELAETRNFRRCYSFIITST